MCTIGALRLNANEYLLFKNKDFVRDSFEDRLIASQEVVGIQGVSTWANVDSQPDEFSGISIGANQHGLFCCDANVREEPKSGLNYDLLTEVALQEGKDVDSAISAVDWAVKRNPHWCANLILIDNETVAAIEVHGEEIRVETDPHRLSRTNHHLLFRPNDMDADRVTSQPRLSSCQRRLASADSVEDVLSLQSSHDHENTGICNHSLYQTVYSYLLHFNHGAMSLAVKKGRPCDLGVYNNLDLPLGLKWTPDAKDMFCAEYPQASI